MTHGQESDFIVKLHEALDDNLAASGTSPLLGDLPRSIGIGRRLADALAMARRAHDRLYDARSADFLYCSVKLLPGSGKTIVGCRQAELLMCKLADALSVHRKESRVGRRNHVISLLLQLYESRSSDSFHLWNDHVRLLLFDDLAELGSVKHGEHVTAMSDLHGRSILITIEGDDLYTITLQFDCNLFS